MVAEVESRERIAEAKRDLGRRLAAARHDVGWTQLVLGHRAQYSRSAIANAEAGTASPARGFWADCDRLLGCGGELLGAYDRLQELITTRRQQAVRERARQRYGSESESHHRWGTEHTDLVAEMAAIPAGDRASYDSIAVDEAGAKKERNNVSPPLLKGLPLRASGGPAGQEAMASSKSALARLLDVLLSVDRHAVEPLTRLSVRQLSESVAAVKEEYQSCRYQAVLDRLIVLLPAVAGIRKHVGSDEQSRLDVLGADMYHVVGSVLLKFGDPAMALVAAERSTRCGLDSGDPLAVGSSARIMTHALMSSGRSRRAVGLAQAAAGDLRQATRLGSVDSVAVYGALLLRGAIAAARVDDRDAAESMVEEATRAAGRLGRDGNDRWTGFGPNNVLQHQAHIALTLGDAGTAIGLASRVRLDKIVLAERRAALFVDVARAYTQWGRHEQGLSALLTAYRTAPEEVRARPVARQVVSHLAALSRGHTRASVADFAAAVGVEL